MQCPKCQFNCGDHVVECPRCGVIFAKYAHRNDLAGSSMPQPETVPTEGTKVNRLLTTGYSLSAIGFVLLIGEQTATSTRFCSNYRIASFFIVTAYVLFCVGAFCIAKGKGLSAAWGLLAFLPLIGLIILILLPNKKQIKYTTAREITNQRITNLVSRYYFFCALPYIYSVLMLSKFGGYSSYGYYEDGGLTFLIPFLLLTIINTILGFILLPFVYSQRKSFYIVFGALILGGPGPILFLIFIVKIGISF